MQAVELAGFLFPSFLLSTAEAFPACCGDKSIVMAKAHASRALACLMGLRASGTLLG